MEISRDVLKIDKKLVTTKRGSCDHFLTKIKISDPSKAGDGRIQKKFLIDFDIWNVEIQLRIRGQNGNNTRKIGHGSKNLMETVKTSITN